MPIEREREEWLQDCPQFIGDPKPGRGPIVGRPLPASFLEFLFAHTSHAPDTVTLVIGGTDGSDGTARVDLRGPACFRHKRVLGQLPSRVVVHTSRLLVSWP